MTVSCDRSSRAANFCLSGYNVSVARKAAMHAFLTRRKFLTVSTSAAALSVARPYISRANDRPLITHGVQSGDVGLDSGVIWARTDRPARMQIEIATTESFRDVRRGVFVDALPQSRFHRQGAGRGSAAGPGHFLPSAFPGSFLADDPQRARGRSLPHRAGAQAHGVVRVGRRRLRPGLGHRRGARRHAHVRDDAAAIVPIFSCIPATPSTPTRRCWPR